jgi:predicted amidohydrolase
MNIEIRNGRVIDPKNGVDRSTSLYVANGKVAGLGNAPAGSFVKKLSMRPAASSAPA